jgi:hypothetical protein
MLPVPLNSSKITSSIREPVSISAVTMIVSEPPSSIDRQRPPSPRIEIGGVGGADHGPTRHRRGNDAGRPGADKCPGIVSARRRR